MWLQVLFAAIFFSSELSIFFCYPEHHGRMKPFKSNHLIELPGPELKQRLDRNNGDVIHESINFLKHGNPANSFAIPQERPNHDKYLPVQGDVMGSHSPPHGGHHYPSPHYQTSHPNRSPYNLPTNTPPHYGQPYTPAYSAEHQGTYSPDGYPYENNPSRPGHGPHDLISLHADGNDKKENLQIGYNDHEDRNHLSRELTNSESLSDFDINMNSTELYASTHPKQHPQSILIKVFANEEGLQARTLDSEESQGEYVNSSPRLIVDVDGGVDDYQAMVILLDAHKKDTVIIEAITCTAGNTHVKNCIDNVFRLLETARLLNIPVYAGTDEQLVVHSSPREPHIYGGDGFGDVPWAKLPYSTLVQKDMAPIAMINIVKQYPNEVTLLALAPLTNVALAMKLYNNFIKNLKQIYIVGGNFKSRHADFNTMYDPEATHLVLDKSDIPLVILPPDICLDAHFNIFWYRDDPNFMAQNPVMAMLEKAEERVYQGLEKNDKWYSCDPKAVLSFLYPNEFVREKFENANVHVELHDTGKRGRIVYGRPLEMNDETLDSNVTWITKIDHDFYSQMFMEAFRDICGSNECIDFH